MDYSEASTSVLLAKHIKMYWKVQDHSEGWWEINVS